MKNFENGKIKVLVATTVIEVGINVPNSNIMVIYNAERFGLSQLHQLRGRIGRGNYESFCILVSNNKSTNVKKRMDIMCSSNDGFYISEQDFLLRGYGDILGYRQSGEARFKILNIQKDYDLLKSAIKYVDAAHQRLVVGQQNPDHPFLLTSASPVPAGRAGAVAP